MRETEKGWGSREQRSFMPQSIASVVVGDTLLELSEFMNTHTTMQQGANR
jgi:hypothetical protein